jgi:hypothetical protein
MAILTTGNTFSTGQQVLAASLNSAVNSSSFTDGAINSATMQFFQTSPTKEQIGVKDGGISTAKIASGVNINFNSGSAGAPSITRNGDTNTGIFFPSDDQVAITAGGNTAATFSFNEQGGEILLSDSSGNGSVLIDNFTGTGRFLKDGTGGVEFGTTGVGAVSLIQGNANRLMIANGGNVGIGTVSPTNKLDVNGGITVSDGVRGGMKYGALLYPTDANQTSIELTGIPNWAKRITVLFRNLKTNGTAFKQFQLGNSSAWATTIGGMTEFTPNAVVSSTITTGLGLRSDAAADTLHGTAVFTLLHGSTWVGSVNFSLSNTGGGGIGNCYVDLPSVDRIRLTTVDGTNKFDTGIALGIYYEG